MIDRITVKSKTFERVIKSLCFRPPNNVVMNSQMVKKFTRKTSDYTKITVKSRPYLSLSQLVIS